jgi:hypothetical protein
VEHNRSLYVCPGKEVKWCKVLGSKWPGCRVTAAGPFLWHLSIQEVPNCNGKMLNMFCLAGIGCREVPSASVISLMNSFNMSRCITQVTVCAAKWKAETLFVSREHNGHGT